MPRYKIIIEYDGSNISGWQRQAHCASVQQFIEEAIEKFSKEKVTIHASGRTDAGVHAKGQVAHFDLERSYSLKEVQGAINYFLKPNKIIIIGCEEVNKDFHARFSSLKRHYQYVVLNRKAASVLDENRSWHIRDELNIKNMQMAAKHLLGKHDFTSFRAVHCQAKSPIKTIDEIEIFKEGEKIFFNLKATSFLHHMVRNIVGSLVLVGQGKWQPDDIEKVLEAKDRSKAGATAPACGLYFVKVDY
jgi:tRNA pseudouridine38-40 synthase